MHLSPGDVVQRVLDRYGRTYSDDAGIGLTDEPAPLFQLLVLAQLLSARIAAGIAVAAARELISAGWTSPGRLRDAPRSRVIAALGRAGYRRYDERSATQLRDMAELVLDRYGGDLRCLAIEADCDVGRASGLVQQVKGIGPTGAGVFLREVQHVSSDDLTQRFNAVDLVKKGAEALGGKGGGGRPDMAQAGGPDGAKANAALDAIAAAMAAA